MDKVVWRKHKTIEEVLYKIRGKSPYGCYNKIQEVDWTYIERAFPAETMREGRMEGKKMRERQILLDWMTVDGYSKLR